jgi:hypothetical protein
MKVQGLAVLYLKAEKRKSKKIRPSEKAMELASIKMLFDRMKELREQALKERDG